MVGRFHTSFREAQQRRPIDRTPGQTLCFGNFDMICRVRLRQAAPAIVHSGQLADGLPQEVDTRRAPLVGRGAWVNE